MAALEVPIEMLRQANRTYEVRGFVRRADARDPLVCDGRVVGFVTPHEHRWGHRIGPIFVLPEYRGRGLVTAYYRARPSVRFCAFISDSNPASRRLHERASFVNWRRGNGGWFMRREPTP